MILCEYDFPLRRSDVENLCSSLERLTQTLRFYVKTLPSGLRAIGTPKVAGGPIDPDGTITVVTGLLRVSKQYGFEAITGATNEALGQHTTRNPAGLSRLIQCMRKTLTGPHKTSNALNAAQSGKTLEQWRSFLFNTLLPLAHEHKVYAMLPGIYFLLLSLLGPKVLSKEKTLSSSDKIRCATGFPFVLRNVIRALDNPSVNVGDLDHRALWEFSALSPDLQSGIWEYLPVSFQFESWEQLESGVLDTVEI